MTVPGPFLDARISDLIEDCSALPAVLRTGAVPPVIPHPAPAWVVSDECQAQAEEFDSYA